MRKIINQIPNIITLGNLTCGVLSILAASRGAMIEASLWIIAGAGFDFLDGAVARLLKAKSIIGADLDSLSDLVTFGVAPGVMLYFMMESSLCCNSPWLKYSALLIPIFAAVRLARFNNDDRQTESFIGLPVPAVALFFIAIPFAIEQSALFFVHGWLLSASRLAILVLLFSQLMVMDIPLFSLKFKNFRWKDNWVRYLFLLLVIPLIIWLQLAAFLFIIPLYILISVVVQLVTKHAKD